MARYSFLVVMDNHLPLLASFLDLSDVVTSCSLTRSMVPHYLLRALPWNRRFREVFVSPGRRPSCSDVRAQFRWYLHLERVLVSAGFRGSEELAYESVRNLVLRLSRPPRPHLSTNLAQSVLGYGSWTRQLESSDRDLTCMSSGGGPLSRAIRLNFHKTLPASRPSWDFYHSTAPPGGDRLALLMLWKVAVLRYLRRVESQCECAACFHELRWRTVRLYGLMVRCRVFRWEDQPPD